MATTLVWQDRFSVGVKGIDRQHRELLARLNALFDAVSSHASGEDLESLVDFLKGFVHTHFACEERLMRRHAYPGYARHLAEHQGFIDDLAAIDRLYDRAHRTEAAAERTAATLATWLVDHFQRSDRELAEFLRAGSSRLRPAAGDPVALPGPTADAPATPPPGA